MFTDEFRSSIGGERPPKQDFAQLLDEIVVSARGKRTLAEAATSILTLDGRIPAADAAASLSPAEARFIADCGAMPILAASAHPPGTDRSAVLLGISPTGRLRFAGDSLPCRTLRPVATLLVEPGQSRALLQDATPEKAAASAGWECVLPADDPGRLLSILDVVEYAIDHIDPVILYVEEEIFTNFDEYNNLLGRAAVKKPGYILTDLRSRPFAEWTSAERILVASVYLLATARMRVEEFNAQQINLALVEASLRARHETLCRLAGRPVEPVALADLPAAIAALRAAIRPEVFAYRLVNGLTFNKHEHFMRRDAVDLSVAAIPAALSEGLERAFGVASADHATIDSYFGALIAVALAADPVADETELTAYETLLEAIVRSAIAETGSQIGMTRGLRDFHHWAELFRDARFADICNMPPTDYYCAVFAAPDAEATLRHQGALNKIVTAIAQRMTFNSWHYTPGHVPIEAVPEGRHFYVPPRMSDLAVWSDKHHQGHVLASVRYSIRSPAGLVVNGVKQHGLCDLRMMRRDGAPYEIADLLTARRHTAYLRAALQASIDADPRLRPRQIVRAFNKTWYKNV